MKRVWTTSEVEYIKQAYGVENRKVLEQTLGRTWASIEHFALKSGLKRRADIWSQQDVTLLQKAYSTYSQASLEQMFPNRSWESIRLKAKSLRLTSRRQKRKSNLAILLQKTPTTSYWLGFLLADGHFGSKGGNHSIELTISIKDKVHLEKFAHYVGGTISMSGMMCRFRAHDSVVVKSLMTTFDINSNKTKSPPSVDVFQAMNIDNLLAMFIGFIDGDGCISRRGTGRIQIHGSWLETMKFLCQCLEYEFGVGCATPHLNTSGYVDWHLSNIVLFKLKSIVVDKALPVLERKWGRI